MLPWSLINWYKHFFVEVADCHEIYGIVTLALRVVKAFFLKECTVVQYNISQENNSLFSVSVIDSTCGILQSVLICTLGDCVNECLTVV